MIMSSKKKYLVLLLLPFIYACKTQECPPTNVGGGSCGTGGNAGGTNPTLHVSNVSFPVFDGNNLYANGAMQKEVQLTFSLIPTASVELVEFLDASTGLAVAPSSGWLISNTPNPYDRVIPSDPGTSTPIYQPSGSNSVFKYVSASTQATGKTLSLCAVINTISNGVKQKYSTCGGANLEVAQINAIAPETIPHTSFSISHVSNLLKNREEVVDVYALKATGSINPNITSLTYIPPTTTPLISEASTDYYNIPGQNNVSLTIPTATTYEYQLTDHNSTFISYHAFNPNVASAIKLLPTPVVAATTYKSFQLLAETPAPALNANPLVKFIRLTLGRDDYLYASGRCRYTTGAFDKCRNESNISVTTDLRKEDRDPVIQQNKLDGMVQLRDNFGTVHTVKVRANDLNITVIP